MKHLRWIVLGLLFCASVINYIDRQSLSMLARTIQDELHISDVGYATVVQMFLFAYMLSFLVAGWITDRLGSRASMAVFIGWWSIANMLTAFVGSMRSLAAARFMLGAGESGLYVVAPKIVSQLFPPSQKGLAVGVYSAGATIGATIAPPVIAWITLRYGWRSAFVAGGMLGLLWIVPWLLVYRNPKPVETAAAPDEVTPLPSTGAGSDRIGWRDILTSKPVLMLLAMRMLTDPVWQFVLFWFPKYLEDVQKLSLHEVGRIAWIVYLAADIGGIVGGHASDALIHRGFRPAEARKWVLAACAVLVPCGAVLVPRAPSSTVIVVLVAILAFAVFTWMVTATTLAVDVLPGRHFGKMFGVIAAGNGLGGMVFMYVVGRLVTSYSYTPVFVLMGCLHPLALIIAWRLAKHARSQEVAVEGAARSSPLPEQNPAPSPSVR